MTSEIVRVFPSSWLVLLPPPPPLFIVVVVVVADVVQFIPQVAQNYHRLALPAQHHRTWRGWLRQDHPRKPKEPKETKVEAVQYEQRRWRPRTEHARNCPPSTAGQGQARRLIQTGSQEHRRGPQGSREFINPNFCPVTDSCLRLGRPSESLCPLLPRTSIPSLKLTLLPTLLSCHDPLRATTLFLRLNPRLPVVRANAVLNVTIHGLCLAGPSPILVLASSMSSLMGTVTAVSRMPLTLFLSMLHAPC